MKVKTQCLTWIHLFQTERRFLSRPWFLPSDVYSGMNPPDSTKQGELQKGRGANTVWHRLQNICTTRWGVMLRLYTTMITRLCVDINKNNLGRRKRFIRGWISTCVNRRDRNSTLHNNVHTSTNRLSTPKEKRNQVLQYFNSFVAFWQARQTCSPSMNAMPYLKR